MAEIILYIDESDAKKIVEWINADSSIAWIVKDFQAENVYRWRAVNDLYHVEPKSYCLWYIGAGPLRIPSGSLHIEDALIMNPFLGWEQTLEDKSAETPWFGRPAPETFIFTFRERGRKNIDAIGRSGFYWIGNYFRAVGIEATPECTKWWEKLKRFVKKNSVSIPWPDEHSRGKTTAYAFSSAYKKLIDGCEKDINP